MSDQYAGLRAVPLLLMLQAVGVDTSAFKARNGGTEHGGPCPACKPTRDRGDFSARADGRYECLSCGIKGRGAIDLVMAVKNCNFQSAVDWAKTATLMSQAARPVLRLLPPTDASPNDNAQLKAC